MFQKEVSLLREKHERQKSSKITIGLLLSVEYDKVFALTKIIQILDVRISFTVCPINIVTFLSKKTYHLC